LARRDEAGSDAGASALAGAPDEIAAAVALSEVGDVDAPAAAASEAMVDGSALTRSGAESEGRSDAGARVAARVALAGSVGADRAGRAPSAASAVGSGMGGAGGSAGAAAGTPLVEGADRGVGA
jgi:hypothetical protein